MSQRQQSVFERLGPAGAPAAAGAAPAGAPPKQGASAARTGGAQESSNFPGRDHDARAPRETSPKRRAQAGAATAPTGAPAAGGPPRRPVVDGSQVSALRAMLTIIKGEAEAGGGAPRAAGSGVALAPEAPRAAAARLSRERDSALELAEVALRGQEALLVDRCRLAGECAALRRERDDLAERVAFLLHAGAGECGYDELPITPDSAAMRALRAGEAGACLEGLEAVAARLDLGA